MILYQATFQAHVQSIIEHGLGAVQKKNWCFSKDHATYFTTDIEVAISFCEEAQETPSDIYESGIVVFSISDEELKDWRIDENVQVPFGDEAYITYIRTKDIIPYAKLTQVRAESTV